MTRPTNQEFPIILCVSTCVSSVTSTRSVSFLGGTLDLGLKCFSILNKPWPLFCSSHRDSVMDITVILKYACRYVTDNTTCIL